MIDAEALMRFAAAAIVAFALTVSCSKLLDAQTDPDRVIPDGGILVRGWTGKIDAASATAGAGPERRPLRAGGRRAARDDRSGDDLLEPGEHGVGRLHGEGDVSRAEVHEPEQPLRTRTACSSAATTWERTRMSLRYCVACGDGQMLVRGFGPAVFTLFRQAPNAAVHKSGSSWTAR